MHSALRRRILNYGVGLLAGLGLAIAAVVPAQAQTDYPSRTISIVVPHPPGGSVDGVARLFANKLEGVLGQSVIIENRAGASGMIGAGHVARSDSDGYTLYINASIHSINPLLYKERMKFDAVNDFTAISLLAKGALIFTVNPEVDAHTPSELISVIKEDPDSYTFATTGFGAASHLAIAHFRHEAGLHEIPIVLYKGGGPALVDMLGGQVQALFDPFLSSLPHVQSGGLRAIAVTGTERAPQLPDVPTVSESGMEGFQMYSWYGLWSPAGLPDDILSALEQATQEVMSDPEIIERLERDGFEVDYRNSSDFAKFIDEEMAIYAKIIEDANITIE